MDDPEFLALDNVSLIFADDGTQVLSNVSLSIRNGAFVSLVGASGIGKSTLLRILGGLLIPSSGEVLLNGQAIHRNRDAYWNRFPA